MQNSTLDLSFKNIPPLFYAMQGDTDRQVQVSLFDGGVLYDASSDAVSVWYSGPGGDGNFSEGISIERNVLTITLNGNVTAVPGNYALAVMLSRSNGKVSTWNMILKVGVVPGYGSPAAQDYFEAFQAGELAQRLESVNARITSEVATLNGSIANESASLASQIETVNSRISGIIADGQQTEGNTELIDIRTGWDGTKYKTAGDAVREQVGKIENVLEKIVVSYKSKNLINPSNCTISKRMYVNGTVYDQQGDFYTDFIPVNSGDTVWSGFNGSSFVRVQMRHVCAFDSSKSAVSSLGMQNPSYSFTVPDGVSYIVATIVNPNPDRCSLTIGESLPDKFYEYFDPYFEPVEKAQVEQNKSEISEIKGSVSNNQAEIELLKSKNSSVSIVSNSAKGLIRKSNQNRFGLWKKPDEYSFDIPFGIFTDGNTFKTDFNAESYKNRFQNVKYIAPNGDDSADGSAAHPWKSFSKIASLNEVTCYMTSGIYTLENFKGWDGRLYKNFDLIGLGDVKIIHGDCPTEWILEDGVYKAPIEGNCRLCVDVFTDVAGIIYTKAADLLDCKATKCSYFTEGGFVYVNTTLDNPNGKIARIFNDMSECFLIYAHAFDTTPYIENIKWYGSPDSTAEDSPSVKFVSYKTETGKSKAVFNNCGFYCGYVGVQTNQLAETIFYKCETANVYTDGFQYFGDSKNIEIECKGYSCGLDHIQDGGQFDNGSTAHGKCNTLRINSVYYDNKGGNCADALDTNSVSICIGCSAFDSKAEITSQGFALQGGQLSRMYLEGCTAFGNIYDIQSGPNGTITIKNCEYDELSENGGIIITIQ